MWLAGPEQASPGKKSVRLGNFVARFEIAVPFFEGEELAARVGPDRFDGEIGGIGQSAAGGPDPEARRDVVLKDLDLERVPGGFESAGFVAVVVRMGVSMTVARGMTVIVAGGQQPGACEVHRQANKGNRNGLAECDRHRVQESLESLIRDQ